MALETLRTEKAKSAFWQQHINCWQHSGITQAQYCKNNMLAVLIVVEELLHEILAYQATISRY